MHTVISRSAPCRQQYAPSSLILLKCLAMLLLSVFAAGSAQAATIEVNTEDLTVMADDGFCNLFEAVEAVNSNTASGAMPGECIAGEAMPVVDVITFDPAMLPAIITPFVALNLTESVHIQGPHRDLLTLTSPTFSRVFVIQNAFSDTEFTLSDMTLQDNGLSTLFGNYGAAVLATLFANSSLTMERMLFKNNYSETGGGAVGLFGGSDNLIVIRDSVFEGNHASNFDQTPFGGGAIFIGSGQTVQIKRSTFVGNYVEHSPGMQTQSDGSGGAILIRSAEPAPIASVEIDSSTFSGNSTTGFGGAIALGGPGFPEDDSELTIRFSTLTLNEADSNDDELSTVSGGGAIFSSSSAAINLMSNIIATNTDQSNMPANDITGAVATFGYNLIGDNSDVSTIFPAGQPNANLDWVGVPFVELLPGLDPLADNGGPTPTHALQIDSIALDQGRCNNQTWDQRRFQNTSTGLREFDDPGIDNALSGCDIGAFELYTDSANPMPEAITDQFEILEGEILALDASQGVLANDVDNNALVVISAGVYAISTTEIDGEVELGADGSVGFATTDPDAFGSGAFGYEISDGFNSDNVMSTIEVLPVNDAPSFVPLKSTIDVDAGDGVFIPGWAQNISPGPANESDQSVVFAIEILSGMALFSDLPTVLPNGDLSFFIESDVSGTAELSIELRDDGGTDNGGVFVSDAVPLIIVVHENVIDDRIFWDGFEILSGSEL